MILATRDREVMEQKVLEVAGLSFLTTQDHLAEHRVKLRTLSSPQDSLHSKTLTYISKVKALLFFILIFRFPKEG
jgi:hypothetical protein